MARKKHQTAAPDGGQRKVVIVRDDVHTALQLLKIKKGTPSMGEIIEDMMRELYPEMLAHDERE